MPPRLLLLDTPDIDSDAPVNWQLADIIRQASDVLIAVLTQQKYNDAAVKQFFRKAAEADKPIIVLFNQVDLVADREYWPLWLDTFAEEDGARPELVYVVPYDRRATATLELPFYPVGATGRELSKPAGSLRDDLGTCISTRSRFAPSAARSFACSIRTPAPRLTWTHSLSGRRIRGGVAGTGRGRNGPRPLARRAAAIARGRNPRLVGRPS